MLGDSQIYCIKIFLLAALVLASRGLAYIERGGINSTIFSFLEFEIRIFFGIERNKLFLNLYMASLKQITQLLSKTKLEFEFLSKNISLMIALCFNLFFNNLSPFSNCVYKSERRREREFWTVLLIHFPPVHKKIIIIHM